MSPEVSVFRSSDSVCILLGRHAKSSASRTLSACVIRLSLHAHPFGSSVYSLRLYTNGRNVMPPRDSFNHAGQFRFRHIEVILPPLTPVVTRCRMNLVCFWTGSVLLNEPDQSTTLFILASVTPDSALHRIVCTI